MSSHEYLTLPEVATLLRRNKSTVYKDVEAHRIPAFKIGGRLLFSRQALESWIASHSTLLSKDGRGERP